MTSPLTTILGVAFTVIAIAQVARLLALFLN